MNFIDVIQNANKTYIARKRHIISGPHKSPATHGDHDFIFPNHIKSRRDVTKTIPSSQFLSSDFESEAGRMTCNHTPLAKNLNV